MKISPIEDYSLRCLSHLARSSGRRVTIAAVAEAEGLSEENAAKVLARLRDAGLVTSFRGKDGGYVLSRPAEEISIATVLGDLRGRLFELDRCRGGSVEQGCVHVDDCGIRPVWLTLGEVVHAFLSSVSLADLVQPERAVCARLDDIVAALPLPDGVEVTAPRPIDYAAQLVHAPPADSVGAPRGDD